MKQIFFKSVREDGSSAYAVGKYKQIYEIRKGYTFNPKLPAHVFLYHSNLGVMVYPTALTEKIPIVDLINHDEIYRERPEALACIRVLICYGEVRILSVPVCDINWDWDFKTCEYKLRYTSDSFYIIGEIQPANK